ncbi:GH36 C-terminal domain-containing protein [Bifidobacterium avesanii]|uniref:GH36 C-terminal domain-containing protein n=1 Tax=Bifidobacterium avesanii TaxID=1798157 RepID=UPI0023BB1759|nr:GH36 C-terminal domain-containing protein [Bifidobacterium avesanii]
MVVAMDGSEALVADYAILCQPNRPNTRLRLRGLEPEALYRVRTVDPSAWDWPGANAGNAGNAGDEGRTEEDRSFVRSGAELMHIGINDTDLGGRDFASRLYLVTRL